MDKILPFILSSLTNHPRHKVNHIVWSKDSWTYNLFRLWELIFWRKCGKNGVGDTIRVESAVNSTGEMSFYTLESIIVHIEVMLRQAFSFKLPKFAIVRAPVLALAGYTPSPFMFAIAYVNGVSGDNQNSTSLTTTAQTCTGSDTILLTGIFFGSDATPVTITRNSIGLTQISTTVTYNAALNIQLWGQTAPSSGSFSTIISHTSANCYANTICYSGVYQPSNPTNVQNSPPFQASANGSFTARIAVDSTANSWVTMWARNDNNTFVSGTNATVRDQTAGDAIVFADSDGTVTVSTNLDQTLTWPTNPSAAAIQAQLYPAVAAATVIPLLTLLGVGV